MKPRPSLMDPAQVESIRKEYAAGLPVASIARRYHVSQTMVCKLAKSAGLSRRHNAYVSAYTHLEAYRLVKRPNS